MANGIYTAVSGAVAQTQVLDVVANNVANLGTTGFKSDGIAFAEVLAQTAAKGDPSGGGQVQLAETRIDMRPGALRQTGNPLDVALEGKGFMALREGNEVLYTRGGAFRLTEEGNLIDPAGRMVLDDRSQPIQIPEGEEKLRIASDGTIQGKGGPIGTIRLVEFARPELLQRAGATLFVPQAGMTPEKAAATKVHQGYIETSNVNPVQGMTSLITASRAYEAFHRIISTFQTVDRKAATNLGDNG
ncbi:MAG: flagellar basal-body rod protein FlgF [Deltaproteobacteria bacterium]|nr:flagellar basal-body rod protein FlgF [Deltaproteobacteria bacterium]